MLCFLPPVVATPREPPPRRPRDAGTTAAGLITAIGLVGLLTPVGWSRSQQVYTLRAGSVAALGPRAEDRNLAARVRRVGAGAAAPVFVVGRDSYGAVPPGLTVDAATGALVGTPTVPGLYTVVIGASDGAANTITGSSFKVRVLPPS